MIHRRDDARRAAGGITRRTFLAESGLAIAVFAGHGWAAEKTGEPLFRISLAEWSLHRAIFGKKLDHLDFAKVARREFGLDAVEYVNQFFYDKAKDRKYIAEMKKRADGEGVRSLLIMVDREGRIGEPDKKKRREAVERHFKWVEAARELGCHSVRVNAASAGTYEEQQEYAADGLRQLTEFAAQFDLNVLVENHGGLSSNGKWLAETIRKVNHPRCGTLPDFGNFRIRDNEWYDRYQGVKELMPYAKAVSAKSHDFDEKGNEIHTDYFRMMKIVLDAGYHGYVGIEYEGRKLSEMQGIAATKALLLRVRDHFSRRK
ncbi:MAG: sugar phosphate isomerase/epimerase [Planctomycetota bacterium]|nr:MAG: sugar phosphate isomerase/epimerase [Planctomycetota bacterium]